ncbi:MAG: hypothetical protein ACREBU_00275 [Nitrososphaera sp.]
MATLTATAASSIVFPRFIHSGLYSITGGPFSFAASSGDVVQMLKVPNGFRVKEALLRAIDTPLSAGGTATPILLVGDGDDNNRFMSSSVSLTTVPLRLGVGITTDYLYTYTANDTVDITVSSIAGTDSASQTLTLALVMMGTIDD